MTRTSCALVRKCYILWHKLWLHLTKWYTGMIMHVCKSIPHHQHLQKLRRFGQYPFFFISQTYWLNFFSTMKNKKKYCWKSQNYYFYYKYIRLFLLHTQQITATYIVYLSVNWVDFKQTSEFCDFHALIILCWWLKWLCPADAQPQSVWHIKWPCG